MCIYAFFMHSRININIHIYIYGRFSQILPTDNLIFFSKINFLTEVSNLFPVKIEPLRNQNLYIGHFFTILFLSEATIHLAFLPSEFDVLPAREK